MSIKKFVSTFFALALIAGLVAACASPKPTATTAPATSAPATAAPVQPAATTAPATAVPIQPTATQPPLPHPLPFPIWLARAGSPMPKGACKKVCTTNRHNH